MADKNLSSIIRNAIVPSGVPILPKQAFVNATAKLFANSSVGFDMSEVGATSFTADGGGQLQGLLTGNPATSYNYSANQVADAALVDAILAAHVGANTQNSTIDVSGGSNAVPPGLPGASEEIVKVIFPAVMPDNAGGTIKYEFNLNSGFGTIRFQFDTSINLADSTCTINSGNTWIVNIGVMDAPSPEGVAAFLATLIPATLGWGTVDNADGSITLTDAYGPDFPFVFQDYGSGITTEEIQRAGEGSGNIGALVALGNTVVTN